MYVILQRYDYDHYIPVMVTDDKENVVLAILNEGEWQLPHRYIAIKVEPDEEFDFWDSVRHAAYDDTMDEEDFRKLAGDNHKLLVLVELHLHRMRQITQA